MNRPLISLVLVACNYEQFVRSAVESAFGQTYSPLEIILSDDCSTDRSFEIMQEMAAAYHGPHSVRVTRPPQNLGLLRHLARCFELARGEIVVPASADDVSYPDRVEKVWQAFAHCPSAQAVFTNGMVIDEHGNQVRPWSKWATARIWDSLYARLSERAITVYGFAGAYRRGLMTDFPEIDTRIFNFEDALLSLRSLMVGKLIYLPDLTVGYRRHGVNVSGQEQKSRTSMIRYLNAYLGIWDQALKDLKSPRPAKAADVQLNEQRIIRLIQAQKRRTERRLYAAQNEGLRSWGAKLLVKADDRIHWARQQFRRRVLGWQSHRDFSFPAGT